MYKDKRKKKRNIYISIAKQEKKKATLNLEAANDSLVKELNRIHVCV